MLSIRSHASRQKAREISQVDSLSQSSPQTPEATSLTRRLSTIDSLIQELRLTEARQLVERSLEDQIADPKNGRLGIPLLLLYKGQVSKLLGNAVAAENAYKEALRQLHEQKSPHVELVVNALNGIGSLYIEAKRYAEAKTILSKGLQIGASRSNLSHPLVGVSLSNLGILAFKMGHHSEARLQLTAAVQNLRQEASSRRQLLTALNNLYALDIAERKFANAEQLLTEILRAAQRSDSSKDPELATYYYNAAAFYYYLLKNSDKVLSFTRLGLGAQRSLLISQLPKLATTRRTQFLDAVNKNGEAAEWLYWWAESFDGATKLALETSVNSKGLVQEIDGAQSALLSKSSHLSSLAKKINRMISAYSSQNIEPKKRTTLLSKIEQLQEEFLEKAPAPVIKEASITEVSARLPFNGSLIEIRKFRSFLGDFNSSGERWGKAYYLAWILKPNRSIITIQLGSAIPIESAIYLALKASAENASDAVQRWAQVSDLVLKPLTPALQGSNQWFLSPDAELNRVPFAALPSPQDPAKPLGEAVQLRLLTTGRDLLRLQQPAKQGQSPVVMVNPNFERVGGSSTAVAMVTDADRRRTRSAELSDKTWPALPASDQEGRQIGTLLATRPITGNEATASRLQQLRDPRVLHIASHGFFVADVERKADAPLLALEDQAPMLRSFRGEDPQLRSGLVLAGANHPDADPNDDGYLTAAEAVTLQLDGTELVVLSACNTAQGEIRNGEGVYGLQRSLTVAGARSTLLSLWKVDDAATAEFMTRFYTRLKAGEGRSDALAATQKEFREGLAGNGHWKDPYYWAAWQLVGDWRPIKGL